LSSETVYAISPDLVLREAGECLVLVSTAIKVERPGLDLFTVSPSGRAVLAKLDGIKTLNMVVRELAADFKAPLDEIDHDVQDFVKNLESRQMLVRIDTSFPVDSLSGKPDLPSNSGRQQSILDTKKQLGWAYHQLNWPQNEDIPSMSKARDSLIGSLSGRVSWSCFQNKIHYGPLSPGCICCGEGTWHCLFVNSSCTASCFYCPQNRKQQSEHLTMVDEMAFHGPEDFAGFAAAVGARGISFSGGEPLLFYPALLSYIRQLKQKLGSSVYLWIYTNGDLVDRDKLSELKKAGLDEIRVDISARQYSLTAAAMAREFFENVSIEIPAIPEDLEKVKFVMDALINCGIRYLNLHQLLTTEYNYPAMAARHYTFLHHPGVPVYESEITALKLLNYAVSNHLPLQVNYCSQAYKERIHSKNRRLKALPFVMEDHEEATEKMFIRRITVLASQSTLDNIAQVLIRSGYPASAWKMDEHTAGLVLSSSLLPCIEGEDCKFTLNYYRPYLTGRQTYDGGQGLRKVFQKSPSNNEQGFLTGRESRAEFRELCPLFMKSFYRLIVQKQTWAETVRWLVSNYPVSHKDEFTELANDLNTLKKVLGWEQMETWLPDIY
jgi:uncharacterized protein